MPNTVRHSAWALALLCVGWVGPSARAGEAYYVFMFGSQRTPNNPNYSHTWATFVRVTWPGDGPLCGPAHFEAHTISWLPANGVVRINALLPECGRNFGLHETIRHSLDNCERVSLWGPFPIEGCLFRRALARKAQLEGGGVRYKADDTARGSDRVSNCIHAVSQIVGGLRVRVLSPGWGEVASYAVLLRMRPWILDECPHHWLSASLGLGGFPIIYRGGFNPPRSGALYGPLYRMFGGERNLRATYGPPGATYP